MKMTPALRAKIQHEADRMGKSFAEATEGFPPGTTPDVILKLLKAWNDLTPEQKLAWEAAAVQEDLRAAGHTPTN
jgi:hypothetical protein